MVIQWDAGTRTNYRVGYQGAHDLMVCILVLNIFHFRKVTNNVYKCVLQIWDNATTGVRHPNIVCDR